MKYRVLQHEKITDNIRIGGVCISAPGATGNDIKKAVSDLIYHSVSLEDFGKYWRRVAIVEPNTLLTIADIYNETANGTIAIDEVNGIDKFTEVENYLKTVKTVSANELQIRFAKGYCWAQKQVEYFEAVGMLSPDDVYGNYRVNI